MESHPLTRNRKLTLLVGLALPSLVIVTVVALVTFKSFYATRGIESGTGGRIVQSEASSNTERARDGQRTERDPRGITSDQDGAIGPAPPQQLGVSCRSDGSVSLTWFDNDSFVKSFRVYRSTPGRRTQIAEPLRSLARTSITVQIGATRTNATYEVTAVDVYGEESDSVVRACN
jgi:hypothetical protein